jgi:hypothetical protein
MMRCMTMRTSTNLAIFCGIAAMFAACSAWAAKAECPAQSVVLTGQNSVETPLGLHTYIETMVLTRQTHSTAMDGKWKVSKLKQDMIYPWQIRPPMKLMNQTVDLGDGASMICSTTTSGNVIHNVCDKGNFVLDVWGGKIGYRKTGVTIGKVRGREFEVRFGMPGQQQLNPTIRGTVKDGAANDVSLAIELANQDQDNGRFAYDIGPNPTLTVKARATTDPASVAQKVHWKFPDIPGAALTITPVTATGAEVEAVYRGMPARNGDFGEKTLSASLESEGCPVTEERTFSIFFPRDEKNHPGPNPDWPNWLYYWKQSACGKPRGQNVGVIFAPTMSGCGVNTAGFYSYSEPEVVHKHVYLCDLRQSLGSDMKAIVPKINYDPAGATMADRFTSAGVETFTGIDSFGYTMYHEFLHYQNYAAWWEGQGQPYENGLQPIYDKDMDGIPDSKEPDMGFDPTKTLTYAPSAALKDHLKYDEHWIVYSDASGYQAGLCDKEDWAYRGKQWP